MQTGDGVKKLNLVITGESNTNSLWGRMYYGDDLLVETAAAIDELQQKMKGHLLKKYHLHEGSFEFDLFYDLTALFKEKNFLNISVIAQRSGISRSLMAQYAAGIKFPSLHRAAQIQEVIHGIGNELLSVNLSVKMQPVYSYPNEE